MKNIKTVIAIDRGHAGFQSPLNYVWHFPVWHFPTKIKFHIFVALYIGKAYFLAYLSVREYK